MVPRMASKSAYETRYGKTEGELRALTLGLVTAGYGPTSVAVGDAPDGYVTFGDAAVYVEVAEVIDRESARYTNTMSDLNREVLDAINGDPVLASRVRGQHLEIRLGTCPSRADLRSAKRAILDLIRDGVITSLSERKMHRMESPTILAALGTWIYRVSWPHGSAGGSPHIVHIQASAHSFDPCSIDGVARATLAVKRKKGRAYRVKPLWLVLGVTDIRGVWADSIDLLSANCPSIEPYERVIVHGEGIAVIWSADGTVRRIEIASPPTS
ncbi:MAG: hypothetical protein NVSMB64_21040 [Candidatus Velthaea sp.]